MDVTVARDPRVGAGVGRRVWKRLGRGSESPPMASNTGSGARWRRAALLGYRQDLGVTVPGSRARRVVRLDQIPLAGGMCAGRLCPIGL
jgi:hypothetical protein